MSEDFNFSEWYKAQDFTGMTPYEIALACFIAGQRVEKERLTPPPV